MSIPLISQNIGIVPTIPEINPMNLKILTALNQLHLASLETLNLYSKLLEAQNVYKRMIISRYQQNRFLTQMDPFFSEPLRFNISPVSHSILPIETCVYQKNLNNSKLNKEIYRDFNSHQALTNNFYAKMPLVDSVSKNPMQNEIPVVEQSTQFLSSQKKRRASDIETDVSSNIKKKMLYDIRKEKSDSFIQIPISDLPRNTFDPNSFFA
jgi:hypothetical protein